MTAVQDVKSRADIVEVVSEHVTLQKAGRNYKANCPFHAERTPSFIVFPERQTWRCFGACATGGDVITFVMKSENQDFGQALAGLAQRTGVQLPSREARSRHDALYRLNDEAFEYFRLVLGSQEGTQAREYLRQRGIDNETAERFGLGLSPGGREALLRHLLGRGHSEEEAVAVGLATRSGAGGVRDLFHRRLMFPILDSSGRVAGFGGRALDDGTPKYLNTPRTPVFDKGGILYGFSMARESIGSTGAAVIVEGYMDVIAAHQHGYTNVVASMGTALTEQQVALLRNVTTNFVQALDPDNAGREATLRSLESSWRALQIDYLRAGGRSGIVFSQRHLSASLKVAPLPTGRDPDELIRSDAAEWERLVAEAQPLMDFLMDALPPRFDMSSDDGRRQLLDALAPFIRSESNPFTYHRYIRRLSETVALSETELERYVWRSQRRPAAGAARRAAAQGSVGVPALVSLEEHCLSLLLRHPELRESGVDISPDYFEQSENRDIFTKWLACDTIEEMSGSVPVDLVDHLQALLNSEEPPLNIKDRERSLQAVVVRLKERYFKVQELALLEGLEDADWKDIAGLEQSRDRAQEINQQLKELYSGTDSG